MTIIGNINILITKSRSEAEPYLGKLVDEGANIIFFPTIKIDPIYESDELTSALRIFDDYNFIIFTSINSVDVFSSIMKKTGLQITFQKIVAVGKNTAEKCRAIGFEVFLVPDEFSSKGLLRKMVELNLNSKKILIPSSTFGPHELQIGLRELGAEVISVPVYNVTTNDISHFENDYTELKNKTPDIFIFTSPTSFHGYLKLMDVVDKQNYFSKKIICAIGKTTATSIQKQGVTVQIIPKNYTLNAVGDDIMKYLLIK
jgi:uroporphyrinogen-III synthase